MIQTERVLVKMLPEQHKVQLRTAVAVSAQGRLASIQTTPIPPNNDAAISARHAPVWELRAYPHPHTPLTTTIAALGGRV